MNHAKTTLGWYHVLVTIMIQIDSNDPYLGNPRADRHNGESPPAFRLRMNISPMTTAVLANLLEISVALGVLSYGNS